MAALGVGDETVHALVAATIVPKPAQPWVATLVCTLSDQPSAPGSSTPGSQVPGSLRASRRLDRDRFAGEEEITAGAARARALADASRLHIALALRAGGGMCVRSCLGLRLLISRHRRALRAAGLAASRRDGKLVVYSLADTGRTLLAALADASVPAAPH